MRVFVCMVVHVCMCSFAWLYMCACIFRCLFPCGTVWCYKGQELYLERCGYNPFFKKVTLKCFRHNCKYSWSTLHRQIYVVRDFSDNDFLMVMIYITFYAFSRLNRGFSGTIYGRSTGLARMPRSSVNTFMSCSVVIL